MFKLIPLTSTLLFLTGSVCMAQESSAPEVSEFDRKSIGACKQMVTQSVGKLTTQLAVSPEEIEKATCECVNKHLKSDPIFLVAFGSDDVAKQELSLKKNVQPYLVAKGMSYTFQCLAPELAKAANNSIH